MRMYLSGYLQVLQFLSGVIFSLGHVKVIISLKVVPGLFGSNSKFSSLTSLLDCKP